MNPTVALCSRVDSRVPSLCARSDSLRSSICYRVDSPVPSICFRFDSRVPSICSRFNSPVPSGCSVRLASFIDRYPTRLPSFIDRLCIRPFHKWHSTHVVQPITVPASVSVISLACFAECRSLSPARISPLNRAECLPLCPRRSPVQTWFSRPAHELLFTDSKSVSSIPIRADLRVDGAPCLMVPPPPKRNSVRNQIWKFYQPEDDNARLGIKKTVPFLFRVERAPQRPKRVWNST
jgi:hypothetical protein